MRDRTQHHQKHHQKHHQHHKTQANLISIAVLFIFYLLTPIKTYADQPTPPSPTPTSLEIQRTTVGIKGKVLANSDYDVLIPIDTYYKVIFDSTGGSAVSMQFVKENCNAIEPAAPTRANYEFNFWMEKGTYEEFNFTTTPITHDITLKAVWTSTSPSPSPSDENKPNTDKEDTNSSEDTNNEENKKDTSEDNEDTTEDKENSSDNTDNNTEDNGEDSKSNDNNKDNSENSESSENNGEGSENNGEDSENNNGLTENTSEIIEDKNGLINTPTNQSNQSIETDPDIATNTETTDLLSEIKATVLGVFKTIKTSITIAAKISLIGILIWFIWFVILLNNTLVKIQAPSEDQPDQSKRQSKSQRQSKSWKTVYLTPIKKTIEQTDGDKRTVWSLSLPQNLLDDNEELKVKIPWSVYHKAEDTNQANQTELHITIVNQDQSLPTPTMIYIITNETKEITIK